MQKIKIKISTITNGTPWQYEGEGTLQEKSNRTVLTSVEKAGNSSTTHQIEIGEDFVFITRFHDTTTRLEIYRAEEGHAHLETEFGKMDSAIETISFAIKKTPTKTHITLGYLLDFDDREDIKKVQISYQAI